MAQLMIGKAELHARVALASCSTARERGSCIMQHCWRMITVDILTLTPSLNLCHWQTGRKGTAPRGKHIVQKNAVAMGVQNRQRAAAGRSAAATACAAAADAAAAAGATASQRAPPAEGIRVVAEQV